MNMHEGGKRILLALCWIFAIIVALASFNYPVPLGATPEDGTAFQSTIYSIAVGAILVAFLSNQALTEHEPIADNFDAGLVFAGCLWGLASGAISWGVSIYMAWNGFFGPWEPPFEWMFRGNFGPGLSSVLLAGLIWLAPFIVLSPLLWLFDGFTKQKNQ